MNPTQFGPTKASLHLVEALAKENNKNLTSLVSRRVGVLGETLNELTLLRNIKVKRNLAKLLRERLIHDTINDKSIKNEVVRDFLRCIIMGRIANWLEREEVKEKRFGGSK